VRHALNMGYKFGFTGGTDSHSAEPGHPGLGGITGVYASGLSRTEIFDAMTQRRTFATSGPRMILSFSINGRIMGQEISADNNQNRNIKGRAITCDGISEIEIIRNGEVVRRFDGEEKDDVSFAWLDMEPIKNLTPRREITDEEFAYYYMRVKTIYGDFGWTSPIWVCRGRRGKDA
jgi:hypothetical protein